MTSRKKNQKSKKARKRKIIKRSDLLPESRQFLLEKALEKKKEEKKKEITELKRGLASLEEVKPLGAEEDAHKRLAMWAGVIFFTVLIFAVWMYNIRATFRAPAGQKENEISWDKITENFRKTMGEMKENIADIKEAVKTATTTEEMSQLSEEEIKELKEKLERVGGLGTSTSADGMATSSE